MKTAGRPDRDGGDSGDQQPEGHTSSNDRSPDGPCIDRRKPCAGAAAAAALAVVVGASIGA